ncbi:MAG: VWA domain-containing protein, partial [Acidobacteria bacterium]|nr:VWA domain-containing protein [Acidobacteriota bacterium]
MDGILQSSLIATTSVILALTPAARGASLPEGQFSSAVPQVEVYASVADAEGRPVQGLTRGDFTVLEDDRPQAVTAFAAGEFPASVALAIDRSVSMAGARLTVARTAGRVFVASLRPDDRAMLIGIGSDVELLAPLSANRESVLEALDHLDAWGTTALYDAIVQSIDLLANGHGRRAIVLLSDGNDRYSRATARDVLERIRRSDV